MEAAWGFPQWILTSSFKRVVKWLLKRQAAKVTVSAGVQALFAGICTQILFTCRSPECAPRPDVQ